MRSGSTREVLFVCTHNATRSPMAAALARSLDVPARSAGVYADGGVDPRAVAAMAEVGVDIRDHRAHTLTDLELSGEDLAAFTVIALTDAAAEDARARLGDGTVERWPLDDPTAAAGDGLEAHRRARDAILSRIRKRFTKADAG